MYLQSNTLLQGGKYLIVRFLSNGGFGNTYEAIDVECNKKIAIKEFFMKDSCNREETTNRVIVATKAKEEQVTRMKEKFMKEARVLQNMSHPNIVHVENAFEENATAYYVMDYIEGTSLNDIIKVAGSLSEEKALDYIIQIADALSYVHSKNILHLDIKPGNIMVDKHGKAILIDFGASKQYDEVTGENTSTLLGINTTGYTPAEQSYRGFVQFAPSTDIYALGATLYKLLTGITPPDAQMLKDGEAELAPLPSNISESVKQSIKEAMRPLRKDRPQSIEDFMAMLSQNYENKQEKFVFKPNHQQAFGNKNSDDSNYEATLFDREDIVSQNHEKLMSSNIEIQANTIPAEPNAKNRISLTKKQLVYLIAYIGLYLGIAFLIPRVAIIKISFYQSLVPACVAIGSIGFVLWAMADFLEDKIDLDTENFRKASFKVYVGSMILAVLLFILAIKLDGTKFALF